MRSVLFELFATMSRSGKRSIYPLDWTDPWHGSSALGLAAVPQLPPWLKGGNSRMVQAIQFP